jgi:hypothetical protein
MMEMLFATQLLFMTVLLRDEDVTLDGVAMW